MPAGPKCLNCGSSNMSKPGFVSYHWVRNKWVPMRRSAEMADSDRVNCHDCGTIHQDNGMGDPPFDLEIYDDREELHG